MPVRGHWDLPSLRQPAGRTHDKDLSQVCNEDTHRCGEESEGVWSDSFASFLTIFFPFASVLHCYDQISNRNNLQEEGFIWAPLSRDVTPWSLDSKHLGRASWWQKCVAFHFMADQVAESSTGQGLHNRPPRTLYNDLFLQWGFISQSLRNLPKYRFVLETSDSIHEPSGNTVSQA